MSAYENALRERDLLLKRLEEVNLFLSLYEKFQEPEKSKPKVKREPKVSNAYGIGRGMPDVPKAPEHRSKISESMTKSWAGRRRKYDPKEMAFVESFLLDRRHESVKISDFLATATYAFKPKTLADWYKLMEKSNNLIRVTRPAGYLVYSHSSSLDNVVTKEQLPEFDGISKYTSKDIVKAIKQTLVQTNDYMTQSQIMNSLLDRKFDFSFTKSPSNYIAGVLFRNRDVFGNERGKGWYFIGDRESKPKTRDEILHEHDSLLASLLDVLKDATKPLSRREIQELMTGLSTINPSGHLGNLLKRNRHLLDVVGSKATTKYLLKGKVFPDVNQEENEFDFEAVLPVLKQGKQK